MLTESSLNLFAGIQTLVLSNDNQPNNSHTKKYIINVIYNKKTPYLIQKMKKMRTFKYVICILCY